MRRALVIAAALLVSGPARGLDPATQLLDLSADTLAPGSDEFGLFWARYARGLTPDLQASVHLLGYPGLIVNGFAKYRFLDRPELRASIEGGVIWAALMQLAGDGDALLLFIPVELRASVPLAPDLELHLGWIGRGTISDGGGSAFGTSTLRFDLALVRTDATGAWILTGRFPLVTRASVAVDSLLGKADVAGALALDELDSWGVLVAREQLIGDRLHVRLGAGYRNTYGILFYESLGHILVNVDVSYRRP